MPQSKYGLTSTERALVEEHASRGYEILAGIDFACPVHDGLTPGQKVNLCIRPEDVRVRDLPADIANRLPVEVAELDFVGAFCRATLRARAAAEVALTADFSSNLIRDLGVEIGTRLDIALPPDRLRVFA